MAVELDTLAYLEAETDALLATKSDTTHNHDTTYADINKNVRMFVAVDGTTYLTNDGTDPDPGP